jgi:hypothetical protein
MYNGNKKLSKQEFVIEQKKLLLIEEESDARVVGEQPVEGNDEGWSKELQT